MRRHQIVIFLTGWLLACSSPTDQQTLDISLPEPVVLKENGPEIYQYWEFSDQAIWWEAAENLPPSIVAFQDSLQEILGDSLFPEVVERQASQRKLGPEDLPFDSLDNADRVHLAGLGKVQPIALWEAAVLGFQMNRFSLLGHPTEFHAFVVEDPSRQLLRIYFTGSDAPFPPRHGLLLDHFEPLLEEGWVLRCHLHNHYNEPEDHYLGVTLLLTCR
ncbi:MAG: hypothetical protein AAF399_20995, partial [Bacteroidota bacterium]